MPIYMDRHDLSAVTAKDVAEAHREDLKIQDKFKCKGLTYWFDEERGTAFCLVEAPNANCVKEMHDHAHGLVPHQIIEVEKKLVDAFLGRIEDPEGGAYPENPEHVINETAYRFIMYISFEEIFLFKSKFDKSDAVKIINSVREIMQISINRYTGREVVKDRKRLIISFTTASNAVQCALEIRSKINKMTAQAVSSLNVKMNLTAGDPITDKKELFGETLQLAGRICETTNKRQVVISAEVNHLYNEEITEGISKNNSLFALNPEDEKFINQLIDSVHNVLTDPKFDVRSFGKIMGLSKSQLYRRISSLTDLSPNEYIREIRLKKALDLIERRQEKIAQAAFETGFNSPSYFSKCFLKRFGILPSVLMNRGV